MIEACRRNGVKLMIGYRLHFEEINLKVVELVRRGRIGQLVHAPHENRALKGGGSLARARGAPGPG